jgi:hypothetical protein
MQSTRRACGAAAAATRLATLLLDLMIPAEEQDGRDVFDVGPLAQRLELARTWASDDPRTRDLPVGYFGASTGAAAALIAAALPESPVGAYHVAVGPILRARRSPTFERLRYCSWEVWMKM